MRRKSSADSCGAIQVQNPTGEMATSPNADGGNGGPGRGGNSLAAIVKAALSAIAEVLTAWGNMPAVRTLPEYLGRKLLVWGLLCGAGLVVGGQRGTIVAVGSLAGLLIDTGLAAWNERNRARIETLGDPPSSVPPAAMDDAVDAASADHQEPERRLAGPPAPILEADAGDLTSGSLIDPSIELPVEIR
ncbi:MAG TPA: hypothetical protein VFT45_15300 [Longimicrobium sp.]|nr:hypothetical protein [Longimicrobium sp.]